MEALDIIRKTMPEFEKVDDDTIKTFISLAEPLISKKRFGKLNEQALAYLSAHKMKLRGLGTSIGIGTPLVFLLFRKEKHRCLFRPLSKAA